MVSGWLLPLFWFMKERIKGLIEEARKRTLERGKPLERVKHGRIYTYLGLGCRCKECKEVVGRYYRLRKRIKNETL